jgi:hypothetical protein
MTVVGCPPGSGSEEQALMAALPAGNSDLVAADDPGYKTRGYQVAPPRHHRSAVLA